MRHKNHDFTSTPLFVCSKCGSNDVHVSTTPTWNGSFLDKIKALLPLSKINRTAGRVYITCNSCGYHSIIVK